MEVTLTAASYRWHCPECGQEHFVSAVTDCVSCPDCGCLCKVAGVQHQSNGDRQGHQHHKLPTQAFLF